MKTGDFVLDILHEVEDYIDEMNEHNKKEILEALIMHLTMIKNEL